MGRGADPPARGPPRISFPHSYHLQVGYFIRLLKNICEYQGDLEWNSDSRKRLGNAKVQCHCTC